MIQSSPTKQQMDNSLAKNSVSMKFDAQPMEEVEIPEIGVMEMSEKPEI